MSARAATKTKLRTRRRWRMLKRVKTFQWKKESRKKNLVAHENSWRQQEASRLHCSKVLLLLLSLEGAKEQCTAEREITRQMLYRWMWKNMSKFHGNSFSLRLTAMSQNARGRRNLSTEKRKKFWIGKKYLMKFKMLSYVVDCWPNC